MIGNYILPLSKAQNIVSLTKQQQLQIKNLFDQAHIHGVLVIESKTSSGTKIDLYGNDQQRANIEYIPASSFKMLNALIGLQNNKATPEEIFKWDGKKRLSTSWEKDMTLGEAMKLSAIPVYQELARRTGLCLMQKEIKKVNFGNNDIGTHVDNFWLLGPLKITPIQEAQFVYRFAHRQLPFSIKVQDEVQQMIFIGEKNGNKIYAKNGWGQLVTPQVGWLAGWVEKLDGTKIAFVLNLEMQPNLPSSLRNDLTYKSLIILDIL